MHARFFCVKEIISLMICLKNPGQNLISYIYELIFSFVRAFKNSLKPGPLRNLLYPICTYHSNVHKSLTPKTEIFTPERTLFRPFFIIITWNACINIAVLPKGMSPTLTYPWLPIYSPWHWGGGDYGGQRFRLIEAGQDPMNGMMVSRYQQSYICSGWRAFPIQRLTVHQSRC